MLEGRTAELAWAGDRVGGLAEGQPFAAVLRGVAGVGKSALLRAIADGAAADGVRVLRTRGYEDEAGIPIPFAGLLELATPLMALADQLPEVQRLALGSALALRPAQAHDRFAVPAALHGLFALAAEAAPLLVIADDVQWLDPATRDALLFVARRLSAPSVGVLLAVRDAGPGGPELQGVDELAVDGLAAEDALGLLRAQPFELAQPVADLLVRSCAGNPLALLELPRALSPEQRAGDALLDDPLPVTAAVEDAFAQRVERLPSETRTAVLVAAAASRSTLDVLTDAFRELGLDAEALGPAEQARIVAVAASGEVSFAHPLLRATAYHAATSTERRAAHAALAASTPDPPRRAWHLAAASAGADETVAAQLESAARDARARGGHAEAARAFARAADLSIAPGSEGRRALEAAQDAAVAGAAGSALGLLDRAEPLLVGEDRSAVVARLRGHLLMRRGEPLAGRVLLESAAGRAVDSGDHGTAATLLLESAISYTMVGDPDGMYAVLDRAAALAEQVGGSPELVTRAIRAMSDVVTGHTAEARRSIAELAPQLEGLSTIGLAEPIGLVAQAVLTLGDLDTADRIAAAIVTEHRDASALGGLPFPLSVRAMVHGRQGHWQQARLEAQEAVEVATVTGQTLLRSFSLAILAHVEGGLGLVDEALVHAHEGLRLAEEAQATNHLVYQYAALGRALLAGGRLEEAAEALGAAAHWRGVMGWREPAVMLDAADHVEVLLRLGRGAQASSALDALADGARLTGSAAAHAAVERLRMLRGPAEDVERHAAAALAWHEQDGMPFERARTQLVWGERLRRRRQRMQAREPLALAHAEFVRLGAAPWAARAAHELAVAGGVTAVGPGGAPRTDAPDDLPGAEDLSAHELRIARMVAYGMTNREVGSSLSLSPKTIERHLSVIYRQLGIRSRTELARLVAQQQPGD